MINFFVQMKLNKFAYSKPLRNHTLKIMKKIPGNLLKNLEISWNFVSPKKWEPWMYIRGDVARSPKRGYQMSTKKKFFLMERTRSCAGAEWFALHLTNGPNVSLKIELHTKLIYWPFCGMLKMKLLLLQMFWSTAHVCHGLKFWGRLNHVKVPI